MFVDCMPEYEIYWYTVQIIDQLHKSLNTPVPYPTMLHSEQKCARFCSEWSIMGYGTGAFWELWIRSVGRGEYTDMVLVWSLLHGCWDDLIQCVKIPLCYMLQGVSFALLCYSVGVSFSMLCLQPSHSTTTCDKYMALVCFIDNITDKNWS